MAGGSQAKRNTTTGDVSPLMVGDAEVEVRRSARRRRTITAYRDGARIVVMLPQRMSSAEESRIIEEMVAKVLAKEQRRRSPSSDPELLARAATLSGQYLAAAGSPEPTSVRWVSNQHHRWGSCTPAAGTIRLSDRLLPMPSWVVDYVLIHELAHLVEREHNQRFWQLVNTYPDADRAQGYLLGWSEGLDHQRKVADSSAVATDSTPGRS